MFELFITYETYINLTCGAFMMLSLFFSSDSGATTRLDIMLGSLTFLAYSTLLLNTVANILQKGFWWIKVL